ncbi:AI-2E family transporter [Bacillus niameyensis]|uniref:AI-2E family transporter n=1 Tax=Bacillus niameyensis TaxID=1522308 RepID=UPI000A6D7B7D|nr:AI-2E family transporter [Bacillus niameyensis]
MKQNHLQIVYKLIIILMIFLILYCFLLIKPLWKPILTAVFIGLVPFLISGFIAFLLHPLVVKLEKVGLNRTLSILLIYILFFAGLGYGLYIGIPLLIKQMREFSEQLPHLIGHYRDLIHNLEASTSRFPIGIQEQVDERIEDLEKWFNQLIAKSSDLFVKLIDFIVVIVVIPFISFYMLKDVELIKRATWYITPKKWRENGLLFLEAVNLSLGGYFRGQFLVCSIVAVLASIILGLLGVQYPVFLGLIIGITNIIPYFGPLIGAFPAVAIAMMTSVKLAIFTFAALLILQFLEGNVLSPFIVGKSLHMHPLFIIGALIIGGELFGVAGMILAVPVFAIIKIAIIHSRDYFIQIRQS